MKFNIIVVVLFLSFSSYAMYGAEQGSFSLNMNFKFGTTFGSVTDLEKSFSEGNQMSTSFTDSTGNLHTSHYEYSNYKPGFDAEISCFVFDKLSAGINYSFDYLKEGLDFGRKSKAYDKEKEKLLVLNAIGPQAEFWPFAYKEKMYLSFDISVLYAFGKLTRFPVIKRTVEENPGSYTADFYSFLETANKSIDICGLKISPCIHLRVFSQDTLYFIVGLKYEYESLSLSSDRISGYPGNLKNHSFSINLGFGILTEPR